MLDPRQITKQIHIHFDEISDAEFLVNMQRFNPNFTGKNANTISIIDKEDSMPSQLMLLQPEPILIPLNAYLACALSGLSSEQRNLMFAVSDAVSVICQQNDIDLYEPRKKTDPVHHSEVRDSDVFRLDREHVLGSDLVIHLCHYPSTGSGEELDFAYNALVPIILISHDDSRVSRMITGIPAFKIHLTYNEPEDLRSDLGNLLGKIRPILEQRKLAFSKYDRNIVGERVRLLREALGLTREEVTENTSLLTVEALRLLEESTDRLSNPSLIQLREIAVILKTTISDLIEPDTNEIAFGHVQDWIEGRISARSRISPKDRNKLLRRMLLRIIDSLEQE